MIRKLLWLLIVVCPLTAYAQLDFDSKAEFAILRDFDTGTVLYAKNADERMYPASMTKIMTAYLLFEELKTGRLQLDDTFNVSKKAYSIGGSRMFLEIGEKVIIEDLIRGIVVQSGNDASIVAAENIAGSEIGFAEIMNEAAQKLGMQNSHFVNSSGWPDENHYTTAQDLLLLSEATIRDFPDYYPYYAERDFTYAGIKQANRNPLLAAGISVDGLKTGHTEASGYGLAASAVVRDRRLMMVINGLNSEAERAEESMRLMEWGLRNFDNYRLLHAGDEIAEVAVSVGNVKKIALTVRQDVLLTLPKTQRRAVEAELQYNAPLIAPLTTEAAVGTLRLSARGKELASVPVYVAENVRALSFFDRIGRQFNSLFGR